jgi:DNA modification methylase
LSGLFGDLPHGAKVDGNHLFYGDNLTIMRNLPDQCVDLIYLDPPFNSQRNYNLIYKQATGLPVPEQAIAFCDAWELDAEKDQLARELPAVLAAADLPGDVVAFWTAWIQALRGTQPKLLAYLVYMTYRLLEMRRILKADGSIYLHCDSTANHYIKVIMDGVFGHASFRNDITWKRTGSHGDSRTWSRVSDHILFYTKGKKFTWNVPRAAHDPDYITTKYRHDDGDGRGRYRLDNMTSPNPRPNMTYAWNGFPPPTMGWRYKTETMKKLHDEGRIHYPKNKAGNLDYTKRPQLKRYLAEITGQVMGDVWSDIAPINSQGKERLGYPTQKPLSLLERIIKTSSNEGDIVFDPFAGCGTAIYAAHLANRRWIGCDIAILSVAMVRDVLAKRHGLIDSLHYRISGVPVSEDGARQLFADDPHQFQHWAVESVGGFCSMKRSNNRGVDGRLWFDTKEGLRSMVLEVKGGKLKPEFTRALTGVLARDKDAMLAGLICLELPTPGMLRDAADAGMIEYQGRHYPRLQLRTVAQLLDGRGFETPTVIRTMDRERQTVLPLPGSRGRQQTLAF